jgi:hypothetical protein
MPISFTKFRLTLPLPKRSIFVSSNRSIVSENHAPIYAPIRRIQQTQEVKAYIKEVREMRRIKEQFLQALEDEGKK